MPHFHKRSLKTISILLFFDGTKEHFFWDARYLVKESYEHTRISLNKEAHSIITLGAGRPEPERSRSDGYDQ